MKFSLLHTAAKSAINNSGVGFYLWPNLREISSQKIENSVCSLSNVRLNLARFSACSVLSMDTLWNEVRTEHKFYSDLSYTVSSLSQHILTKTNLYKFDPP